jgi:hypothetical protein
MYRHPICPLASNHHLPKKMEELSTLIAHKKSGKHRVEPTVCMRLNRGDNLFGIDSFVCAKIV